jgi:hypothetical protein
MHCTGTGIGNGENWRRDSAGWGKKEIGKWGEWGMNGNNIGGGKGYLARFLQCIFAL